VFNPYAEGIVGLSQSVVYDTQIEDVFPQLVGCFYSKSDLIKREFDYEATDGSVMTLGYRIAPFYDSKGVLVGYILNFRDITNIRRMEAALKKADRLAALGELSARMAHEIRNPLAALCGSVQLLTTATNINENDSRLLAIVSREAERLSVLINEFLMYARPSVPQLEMTELSRLFEDVFCFLANAPNFDGITLQNNLPVDFKVRVDVNQFRQVIINLIQNAADAMPGGGFIKIDSIDTPSVVKINITDSGSGISEESARHLFEPFWTTKPTGTGLGLAISYRIIEAHNGFLSVETPHAGGSRFVITLPL
jgi:two-component system sensor histidine kinase PilS (NtrC family)